jgi:hypothetical protein
MIFSHVNLLLVLFKIFKQTEGILQNSQALLQVHQVCYTKTVMTVTISLFVSY